jgi:hypothetical protein
MTGRQEDVGRTLRSLLLEESNAMPVDTHAAAVGLQHRLAHTRKRRRVTLAVAASVVAAAVAVTVAGGWFGVDKSVDPAQNPDQADAVAGKFLAAYGSFDADKAITFLTDDAIARRWGTPEQLRLDFAYNRAVGYKQTMIGPYCAQMGNSESGISLQCAFEMDASGSDEIGLGPYTGNYWRLTVRDGKIVSAERDIAFMTNGFSDHIWEPFAEWVSVEHPDDVLAMYTDESQGMQRVTEDSIRLWEQRTAEYVAVVTQNLDAYPLDQPEVAAYAAQLDSICSAAQARLSNEIQAIPGEPNQPASIEAAERIMRETIPQLRALPVPKAVRWPYEGRAFPLMEEYSQYGKSKRVSPEERQLQPLLLSRIHLTPGLDKCAD